LFGRLLIQSLSLENQGEHICHAVVDEQAVLKHIAADEALDIPFFRSRTFDRHNVDRYPLREEQPNTILLSFGTSA